MKERKKNVRGERDSQLGLEIPPLFPSPASPHLASRQLTILSILSIPYGKLIRYFITFDANAKAYSTRT